MFRIFGGRKNDIVLSLLKDKMTEYGHYLTQDEIAAARDLIRCYFGEETSRKDWDDTAYGSVRETIASYGPAIVVPLLAAYSPHCNPDTREKMIRTLWLIEQPIMREIIDFMNRFPDWQCARATAFEALEERAVQAKEDLPQVIRFFKSLHDDRSSRIHNNLEYAIGNVERTMSREPRTCPRCGRTAPTFYDPDLKFEFR